MAEGSSIPRRKFLTQTALGVAALSTARVFPSTPLFAQLDDRIPKDLQYFMGFRRTGFQALKRVSLSMFYTGSRSWTEIGYEGMFLLNVHEEPDENHKPNNRIILE
jgi:hypothetical protein